MRTTKLRKRLPWDKGVRDLLKKRYTGQCIKLGFLPYKERIRRISPYSISPSLASSVFLADRHVTEFKLPIHECKARFAAQHPPTGLAVDSLACSHHVAAKILEKWHQYH